MAILSRAARRSLPSASFALPGRRYPIHDMAHARNALSRVVQYGTELEQDAVRRAVKRKFPAIKINPGGV